MNFLGLKSKSLIYSISIHIALGLLIATVYMKQDSKHEVYSLVDLQSIQLCAPPAEKPCKQKKDKPQKQSIETKKVHKSVKKVKKPRVEKKIIPVKRPAVKQVAILEPEVKKPLEKVLKPQEKKTEPVEETRVSKTQVQEVENTSSVVTVSEPAISSEAQYMQDNIALINALIKKNLFYPRLAKKRGLQGKAMVSFTLNLEGEVIDIQALGVLSSILKKSAIKTVQKASNSFPHPKEVLALRIPIVYKLH